MVLATDMSCHFGLIKQMKALLTTPDRYGTSLVLYITRCTVQVYYTYEYNQLTYSHCSCTILTNQKHRTEAETVEVGEREISYI